MKFADFKGYEVNLVVETDGAAPCIRSLTVSSLPDGPPVTTGSLRTIPVAQLMSRFIRRLPKPSFEPLSDEEAALLIGGGPTDELLELVSCIYQRAVYADEPPLRAVQRFFSVAGEDLPRSTAGNWIRMARDKGLLKARWRTGRRKIR